MPALIYFTDHPDFPWKKINNLFNVKIQERKARANGETITIEASLFDIITAAKAGNTTAKGLLLFLNRLIYDLSRILSSGERKMVFTNIKRMLMTLDSRFYNFVGEIGILKNILSTNKYRLLHIEELLPNNKTIDFTIQDLESSQVELVEVVIIHLDSGKVDGNPEAIKKFLTGRLTEKILDKQKKLSSSIEFNLIPVIWGGKENLKVYSEFFQERKLDLKNVHEPFGWLQFSDGNDYYAHRFSRLKNLFNDLV